MTMTDHLKSHHENQLAQIDKQLALADQKLTNLGSKLETLNQETIQALQNMQGTLTAVVQALHNPIQVPSLEAFRGPLLQTAADALELINAPEPNFQAFALKVQELQVLSNQFNATLQQEVENFSQAVDGEIESLNTHFGVKI